MATGHTDMRRGMRSLALTVQESLKRDPHARGHKREGYAVRAAQRLSETFMLKGKPQSTRARNAPTRSL
ncbi:hypothetical protein [Bradyrhizobium sp. ISRA442]|uniref:hypothetical protein n=1 Tax=Bradyrhizobium sp. ISRA442 TaxID=2866197 RepID=UPI00404AAD93